MGEFVLTAAARKDMLEIGRFSISSWGQRQCERYLKQIDRAFRVLAKDPVIGLPADDIKPGYRRFRQGRHTIFYRIETNSTVVVIRILHNSMDVGRHI